jgi:hypothetical protein
MTPSDSLPDSPGFRPSALYQKSPPCFTSMGPKGSPQLTHPLSRHVAPDTPEEPRADLPVLHPGVLASPLRYRVALLNLVFTRLHLGSLALRPAGSRRLLQETLSGRLDTPVTGMRPAPHYGADRYLPRSAPFSRLERTCLRWALTSEEPSFAIQSRSSPATCRNKHPM